MVRRTDVAIHGLVRQLRLFLVLGFIATEALIPHKAWPESARPHGSQPPEFVAIQTGGPDKPYDKGYKTIEEADNDEEINHVPVPSPPPLYYCRKGLKGDCVQFTFGCPDYGPPDYMNDTFSDAQLSCSGRPMNAGLSDSDKRAGFGLGSCPDVFTDPMIDHDPSDPTSVASVNAGHSLLVRRDSSQRMRSMLDTTEAPVYLPTLGPDFTPIVYLPTPPPSVAPPVLYYCRHGVDGPCFSLSFGQGDFIESNYPTDTLANAKMCCSNEPENYELQQSDKQLDKQLLDQQSGLGACPPQHLPPHHAGGRRRRSEGGGQHKTRASHGIFNR